MKRDCETLQAIYHHSGLKPQSVWTSTGGRNSSSYPKGKYVQGGRGESIKCGNLVSTREWNIETFGALRNVRLLTDPSRLSFRTLFS